MTQLMAWHIDVVGAQNGDEGLALMRQSAVAGRPYALAMIAHSMPERSGVDLSKLIAADPTLKATRTVLLASSAHRVETEQLVGLGLAGHLLKPVTRRDLLDCVVRVLAPEQDAWHMRSQRLVAHNVRAQVQRRILLAEDNPVNQKVAARLLEKLGYQVVVAVNGSEAVIAWDGGRYDLIFMDCQMPVMDGYEASRQIRERESKRAGERKRIPIVALTAHAMKGADEKCAAAGMDDYLTKPIDRELLGKCLDRWLNDVDDAADNVA
jgi:CheY-like chemotaxis protein